MYAAGCKLIREYEGYPPDGAEAPTGWGEWFSSGDGTQYVFFPYDGKELNPADAGVVNGKFVIDIAACLKDDEDPSTSPSASASPTDEPTTTPSESPSPSESPTDKPSTSPEPTDSPSPSESPTTPSESPTASPTTSPTASPTASPTEKPTTKPTASPKPDKKGAKGTRGAGAKTGGAEPLVTVQMVDEFDLSTALGGGVLVTAAVAAATMAVRRRNG